MKADPAKGGGVFCGPLRLLALEVYEQLNEAGIYCSLLTGQERKEIPFETHVSCTIEMVRAWSECLTVNPSSSSSSRDNTFPQLDFSLACFLKCTAGVTLKIHYLCASILSIV